MKEKIEQFKNENIAILFESQEEYDGFMQILDKYYIKWISGHKASYHNYFDRYDELCLDYDFDLKGIEFSDKTYYESENIKVITYKEFMNGKSLHIEKLKDSGTYTKNQRRIVRKINEIIDILNEE